MPDCSALLIFAHGRIFKQKRHVKHAAAQQDGATQTRPNVFSHKGIRDGGGVVFPGLVELGQGEGFRGSGCTRHYPAQVIHLNHLPIAHD